MASGIQIAVVDSGINENLTGGILIKNHLLVDDENCIVEDGAVPKNDEFLHGTICTLIIDKYCTGNVYTAIRILDRKGTGGVEKLEPALEWCYQNNIKLVNLSLGTTHYKEREILNRLINKYTYKGLVIIAAISNIGYFTFPASFANVIGVVKKEIELPYARDYIHLGIDTIVPADHVVTVGNKEHTTSHSNSYAAPYVTAMVCRMMAENENCDIHRIKKYVRKESVLPMMDELYNPDWIYKAYMPVQKKQSQADYYFAVLSGLYDDVKQEVDTIVAYDKSDLEQVDISNKNLLYLGNGDIQDVYTNGFKWSWQTRVQQIVRNQYRGNGLDIPVIFLNVMESSDQYYILTLLRQMFSKDGYSAYAVSMEPECVLYGIEYIPVVQLPLTEILVRDFIAGQVYYKQNDLILWSVSEAQRAVIDKLYPEYDVEICVREKEILLYIEKNMFYKQECNTLTQDCIRELYDVLINYMEEEHEQ